MTPNDLYKRGSQYTSIGIGLLFGYYFNHIEELDGLVGADYDYKYGVPHETFNRIEVRVIKEFDFDGRRFWRLATVWFDGEPVMVIQNAGREGDDHRERFITDGARFSAMLSYIRSLLPSATADVQSVGADTEIPDLCYFYDCELDGHFERFKY